MRAARHPCGEVVPAISTPSDRRGSPAAPQCPRRVLWWACLNGEAYSCCPRAPASSPFVMMNLRAEDNGSVIWLAVQIGGGWRHRRRLHTPVVATTANLMLTMSGRKLIAARPATF